MAFDQHRNLAVSRIATVPNPPLTGTSFAVTVGEGIRYAPPFNATVCPTGAIATPLNAEIIRVTAMNGDQMTCLRAQEGTTAKAWGLGDLIAATITAQTITDIEAAVTAAANVAHHVTHEPGGNDALANVAWTNLTNNFSTSQTFTRIVNDVPQITLDGSTANADNARHFMGIRMMSNSLATNAAEIRGFGNLNLSYGLGFSFVLGDSSGNTKTERGYMHPSGGFSWGAGSADPGAGNMSVVGNIKAANLKWKQSHTWGVVGDASVLTRLPSMWVPITGSQTVKIVGFVGKTVSGSVNAQLFKNGIAVAGSLIGLSTVLNGPPLDVPLTYQDELYFVLSSHSAPVTVSISLYLEHSL